MSYQELNLMTSYNVAVTVGPNIFRSKHNRSRDIFNHSIYYETLIRMIDHFDEIFTDGIDDPGEEFKRSYSSDLQE